MVRPPSASTSPRRKRPGPLPKPIAPNGLTWSAPPDVLAFERLDVRCRDDVGECARDVQRVCRTAAADHQVRGGRGRAQRHRLDVFRPRLPILVSDDHRGGRGRAVRAVRLRQPPEPGSRLAAQGADQPRRETGVPWSTRTARLGTGSGPDGRCGRTARCYPTALAAWCHRPRRSGLAWQVRRPVSGACDDDG
jgi:hypothetical protein